MTTHRLFKKKLKELEEMYNNMSETEQGFYHLQYGITKENVTEKLTEILLKDESLWKDPDNE